MHNMTNTVTYLTDTNHDPHTHYILDEHDQRIDTFLRFWFAYDVLSVLGHMGSNIISVIKSLGCKIKGERRYQMNGESYA